VSINLLPEELASAGLRQPKRSMFLVAFLLFSCFFLTTNGLIYFKVHTLERQAEYWDLIRTEYNRTQERLEQLEEEIAWADDERNALTTILNTGVRYIDSIEVLQYHLNPQVMVHQITLSKEGWLVVRGMVRTMASVGELAASLGSDAYFLEVHVAELYLAPGGHHSFTLELLTQARNDENAI
jgi:hypothetical protein